MASGLLAFAIYTLLSPSAPGTVAANVPDFVTELALVLMLLGYAYGLVRWAQRGTLPALEFDVRDEIRAEAYAALSEALRGTPEAGLDIHFRPAVWEQGVGIRGETLEDPAGFERLIPHLRSSLRRSILLVGPAGSGKTVFLRRAQADALHATEPNPLFVIFLRLPDWGVSSLGLDAWIEDSAVRQLGAGLYKSLCDADRLVVLLDGLDEIHLSKQTEVPHTPVEAIAELRRSKHRTIVACRDLPALLILDESAEPEWSVVQLMPIDDKQSADRLTAILGEATTDRIVAAMSSRPVDDPSPLKQPLYFQLFLDEVRYRVRRDSAVNAAVRDDGLVPLLLERFVDNAISDHQRPDRSSRLPAARRYYSRSKARSWLHTLAVFVTTRSGTEIFGLTIPPGLILPHHLVALVHRRRTNLLVLVMTAVLWMPLFAVLAVDEGNDSANWRPYAAALGIALLLFVVACAMTLGLVRPIAIVPSRLADEAGLIRMGMAFGVAALIYIYALAVSTAAFAAAYALGFLIPFGFGYTCATRPTLRPRFVATIGLLSAAPLCLLSILVFRKAAQASWLVCGVVTGVAALTAAVLIGAKKAKTSTQILPRGYVPSDDPYYRLRQDKWSALIIWAIAALLAYYVLAAGSAFHLRTTQCVEVAILAGLATGPALVSVAWRRYLAVLLLSPRALPFRLKTFLLWARTAEILRRSEGAYEFRHAALREFIAGSTPAPSVPETALPTATFDLDPPIHKSRSEARSTPGRAGAVPLSPGQRIHPNDGRLDKSLASALVPRIKWTDQTIFDGAGNARSTRIWSLTIANKSQLTATKVRFWFETPDRRRSLHFDNRYANHVVAILPPGTEQEFPLHVTFHMVGHALCVVAWTDQDGEHEMRASVRTF